MPLAGAAMLLVGAGAEEFLFRDAARAWGLTRPIVYGSPDRQTSFLETTGTGVAVLDFDNDGKPDLLFVNGKDLARPGPFLYRNTGTGFTDVTAVSGLPRPGWGQGVCIGDFDNDGWTDAYVTFYGFAVLYRNSGKGTFEDRTREAGLQREKAHWPAGCTFVDYDRDGRLDLLVASYAAHGAIDRTGCNWQGMPVVCGPQGLPYEPNLLYRNRGDGKFEDVSATSRVAEAAGHYCFQPVTADFDGDGWPDIYVSCDSTPNILYRNNRDGTFTDVAMASGTGVNADGNAQASMGVAIGDYDRDGRQDILVTNFSEDTPTLYRNLGGWMFEDVTLAAGLGRYRQYLGWGAIFFDLDNDGWEDLFMANGHVYPNVDANRLGEYRQQPLLYRNAGDGAFTDISRRAGPEFRLRKAARGAATADFNGDGVADLVVVNRHEPPSLFIGRANKGHWLEISLEGTRSNRSAIGARVQVEAGGMRWVREVRSAASFQSSDGLVLHFGLGAVSKIDSARVTWPSGTVQQVGGLTLNRPIRVTESQQEGQ